MLLMWAGNNVTRPFRIAGAAALAPWIEQVAGALKKKLRLPNIAFGFAAIVISAALVSFSAVGLLFLSRLGK